MIHKAIYNQKKVDGIG